MYVTIFRAHTEQHETLPPATAMQCNPRHTNPKPTCGAAHRCHLRPPPVRVLEASLMLLLCRRHRLEDAVGKPGICCHGREGIGCCLRGGRHKPGDGSAESERDEGSLEHHRWLHNSGPLSESNGRQAKSIVALLPRLFTRKKDTAHAQPEIASHIFGTNISSVGAPRVNPANIQHHQRRGLPHKVLSE